MKDVGELSKNAFIPITCIVVIIAAAVGYYCSYVEQQKELLTANKCEHILLCLALSLSFVLVYFYI